MYIAQQGDWPRHVLQTCGECHAVNIVCNQSAKKYSVCFAEWYNSSSLERA